MYWPTEMPGPGLTSNRTVRDSSARVKAIGCCGGVALHPAGRSSFTTVSAAAGVSLMTVTCTSRVALGAWPRGSTGSPRAGRRTTPRPPACTDPAEPRPPARPELVDGGADRIDADGTIA